MENINFKIKFKLASILLILNTLSNEIINNLSEIIDIKLKYKNNKINNINNNIIEFLKAHNEKDIDEFNMILKQVNTNKLPFK